jgi:hypothetical protein
MGTALLGADNDSYGLFCTVLRHMTAHTFSFLAIAGGGGLVAGALIGEAFENHEDREREEAYDQGQLSFAM